MKTHKALSLISLIWVVMLAFGCMQSKAGQEIPSQILPTPLSNHITPFPLITSTPTSTSISLPTLTPTIIPTLSEEVAHEKLLNLLVDNGGCRLPCLWGITPGKVSFQNAQAILVPLSVLASSIHLNSPDVGDISLLYSKENSALYIEVDFLEGNDGMVSRVSFTAEPRKVTTGGYEYDFDSKFFRDSVSAYMLPHILSEQGVPAAVLISTLAEHPTRGGKEGFYMLLFYPEQGILVHYSTQWRQVGNNILGCLSNARIELELFPSGQSDSFSEFLTSTKWSKMWPVPVNSPNWMPIEKATSMSLDQFYEAFRKSTDKCVETPVNLWPTPEP